MDFTSPLFKPQIGFPLGSLLWDSLYVSPQLQPKGQDSRPAFHRPCFPCQVPPGASLATTRIGRPRAGAQKDTD